MAMCPLLREECIMEQCAWWYKADDVADSRCSVSRLPDLLNCIENSLEDVADEVIKVNQQLEAGITVYTWSNE